MSYICQYRKFYPADSRAEVWDEIPMEEGYAMITGGIMLDSWGGRKLADGGYIAQECDAILKKRKT